MNVDDFAHADCTQFRTPPLHTSGVEAYIDEILLTAWQRGSSAEEALNAVLADKRITPLLAKQLKENLAFQKEIRLKRLKDEERQKADEAQAAYEQERARLAQEYGTRVEQTAKEREALYQELGQKQRTYTATQSQMHEMRQRVASHLKTVGGQAGLETLIQINEIVAGGQHDRERHVDVSHALPAAAPESGALHEPALSTASPHSVKPEYAVEVVPYNTDAASQKSLTAPYHTSAALRVREQKPLQQRESFFKKFRRVLKYRIW